MSYKKNGMLEVFSKILHAAPNYWNLCNQYRIWSHSKMVKLAAQNELISILKQKEMASI